MAPHSSTLAWRIPGMAEPGGLLSMGSHRVGHDWSALAAAAAAAIGIAYNFLSPPVLLDWRAPGPKTRADSGWQMWAAWVQKSLWTFFLLSCQFSARLLEALPHVDASGQTCLITGMVAMHARWPHCLCTFTGVSEGRELFWVRTRMTEAR